MLQRLLSKVVYNLYPMKLTQGRKHTPSILQQPLFNPDSIG